MLLFRHWNDIKNDNPDNTTISIFDKKREYTVYINRWWIGKINTFNLSYFEEIIYPIIDTFIQKKEYALFMDVSDHGACIKEFEWKIDNIIPGRDYRSFIETVLRSDWNTVSEKDITICQKSIDICRIISWKYNENNDFSVDEIVEPLDLLLWWTVQRCILSQVKSNILHRNETMNGTGYPFWLYKNMIPINARIYMVIRAYEWLFSMYHSQQNKIIETLKNWAG
jgi:hypothetical protein